MGTKWLVSTERGEVIATSGDALALVDGEARPIEGEAVGESTAFIRADARGLRILAAPGRLVVDGRAAPGGVAVLDGRSSHTVRVGPTTLTVRRVLFERRPVTCEDTGYCAISGEPLTEGQTALFCSCGTVALERFARELGDSCPRCGVRYPSDLEAAR